MTPAALVLLFLGLDIDGASAAVRVEGARLDFGEAIQGDVVRVEARLTNTSKNSIQVVPVEGGCGCALTEEATILPESEARYAIELDTGKTNAGYVLRRVALRTEPGGETITLEVTGTVYAAFRSAPAVVLAMPERRRFVLELHGALPFTVAADAPAAGWAIEMHRSEPQRAQRVTVIRTLEVTAVDELVFRVKHRLGESTVSVPVGAHRGATGTWAYGDTAAGQVDGVNAAGNAIDFTHDDAGQLSRLARASAPANGTADRSTSSFVVKMGTTGSW